MKPSKTEDSDSLSPEGLRELLGDSEGFTEIEEDGPLAFAEHGASVTEKNELGKRILEVGMSLLNRPLLEDAGPNADKRGVIRSLFLEGLRWDNSLWDRWKVAHPSSKFDRPPWCAAFASYCVRKGYQATQMASKLPPLLSASTEDLRKRFRNKERFIERDDLFDSVGRIKPGAPLPAPGDIVLWQGHTGLLYDLYEDGMYQTLEGTESFRGH